MDPSQNLKIWWIFLKISKFGGSFSKSQNFADFYQYLKNCLQFSNYSWKDLFPELLKLLMAMPKIIVNDQVKSGAEFCDSQIKILLSVRWPETILSSIGAMFLEMPITKNDKSLVLNQLCRNLMQLDPQELPTLSFQMFSLCSTPAQLMIPLISLNNYFQKNLYQRLLDESQDRDSDPDRIGEDIYQFLLFLVGFFRFACANILTS